MGAGCVVQALFLHQNFPGQYRHLAPIIARRKGAKVIGLGERANQSPAGPTHLRYPAPEGAGEKTHRYLRPVEAAVRRGQAVARALVGLKQKGFVPDIVCCHPGWGEGLFLRDVFPDAKVLQYCEFYYQSNGGDVGFDPAQEVTLDEMARVRVLNMTQLQSLESSDWCVSPTLWQRSRYPGFIRDKTSVVHEGVDASFATPNGPASVKLPDGFLATKEEEVITFVSRNLEPYRGFDIFMRALPEILARRPRAHAVIVGGEERGYGRVPADGKSWKTVMMEEVGAKLDMPRVHFTGRIPHDGLVALFRLSRAHIYYTYPFVLSWSLVEAMGCEALVIGSDTPPLAEVMRHEQNGILLPFHDPARLAETVVDALANPDRYQPLRKAARRTMLEKFDLHAHCLPRQVKLFDAVLEGRPGSDVLPLPEDRAMTFVPLAETTRGGIPESIHQGIAVVADADGRILQAWGDPSFVTFPRSSLKPFQAIPLVESGAADAAGLTPEHLALACASHWAEDFQVALVRGWLDQLGLADTALVCGPAMPHGQADQAAIWRAGGGQSRVYHNCSGKHCGFLTLTKHLGAPTGSYDDPAHPAQRLFLEAFSELAGVDAAALPRGVDGCGLPAIALPMATMAKAAARWAAAKVAGEARRAAIRRLQDAIRAYPDHLSGRGSPTGLLVRATQGRVLLKGGAEGYVVGFVPDQGIGIAVKFADGASRGKMGVFAALLSRIGLLEEAQTLVTAIENPIRDSNGHAVGTVRVTLPD